MGHQDYVPLSTETTVSNHKVLFPKTSCDVHLFRSACPNVHYKNTGNYLWVCCFLGKNLSNFAAQDLKLHNQYYHNVHCADAQNQDRWQSQSKYPVLQ